MAVTNKVKEQQRIKELEHSDRYYYNKELDKYIIFIKQLGKNIVISGTTHRGIVNSYCSEEKSVDEICATFALPPMIFGEYKSIFNLHREGLAITDEEVQEKDVEDSVESLLQQKKFNISQSFNKRDWDETRKNSAKWLEIENKNFNPFINALEKWKAPTVKVNSPKLLKQADKTFVAVLSDCHFGAKANARYMYSQKSWTTQDTVKAVDKFANQIIKDAKSRNYKFEKAIIIGIGDLIHSLCGKTTRGTELKYDCVREEQFDYALTSLLEFISKILAEFPVVEVHSVSGNHNYETEMALFRALAMAFRTQKNIKFTHYSTRPAAFKTGSTLFLMDHGADSVERTYVPTQPGKLNQHVQSLLLQKPELLEGVKTRLFIQGDKHHWENREFNDFEFIMFSTSLVGDEHSSTNNWNNRARQSSLILDNEGLKEILHTYFD